MTETVRSEAILGGAHSSSVEPNLLCSHRPVSLSRIDAILKRSGKKRGTLRGHFMKTPKRGRGERRPQPLLGPAFSSVTQDGAALGGEKYDALLGKGGPKSSV